MNQIITTVLTSARQYVSAHTSAHHLLAHGTHSPELHEVRRRGPHPGDILFWVACVGGVGLLLLASTT
jgi:hypothetical protein